MPARWISRATTRLSDSQQQQSTAIRRSDHIQLHDRGRHHGLLRATDCCHHAPGGSGATATATAILSGGTNRHGHSVTITSAAAATRWHRRFRSSAAPSRPQAPTSTGTGVAGIIGQRDHEQRAHCGKLLHEHHREFDLQRIITNTAVALSLQKANTGTLTLTRTQTYTGSPMCAVAA